MRNAGLCKADIKATIESELEWINYARKMKMTLEPEINSEDLKMISEYDIKECQHNLNRLVIKRIREHMLNKGKQLFNYDPEEPTSIVIGDTEYGVRRKAYEQYCSDLEQIIDKYIRI